MKAFDLFSGGGGFRQGAQKAGMEIIAHCEIDKWAELFYKQAFDAKGELYFNDATKIDTGELPDFDVLLAGFPCQAFSIAGKRQGFEDSRGTLFFEVARILKDKRPRYFLLENVKGLLNHDNGKTFQTILKILSDIGIYSIEWAVLNSKHFGVPQNRERVFIVGYPREYGIGKIFPIGEASELHSQTRENKEEVHNLALTLKARDYASWGGNFLQISGLKNLLIDDYNGTICKYNIAPTVRENFRNSTPRNGCKLVQNHSIRRLTPLECFRLQGFSDEVFNKGCNSISDAQLYKIAGNSVTVNVVYEITKKIVVLDKEV